MNQDNNQKRKFQNKNNNKGNNKNFRNNNKGRHNGGTFNNRNPRKPKRQNRTVLVSNLYLDDFNHDNRNLVEHYREQRIKLVVELFDDFGEVESIEKHLNENCLLITFKENKSAYNSIKVLGRKPELTKRINRIRDSLESRKLPQSLAPNPRMNIAWSDRPAQNVQTVSAKQENVVAPEMNGTRDDKRPTKKPEKKKNNQQQETKNKTSKKQKENEVKPELTNGEAQIQPTVDGTKLRKEAELLRFNEYLDEIKRDKASLSKDLKGHTERFETRQKQIDNLTKELKRLESEIDSVRQMLDRQQTRQSETDTLITQLKKQLQQAEQEEQSVTEKIASVTSTSNDQ
eukprot:gb/GECH01012935.1/.p1 GENE.gb/GECH01012935.1/~~gb/GECH01012935.1/.p1  ORF type:complete len:344 (+),score=91.77 gb/GECH01012935.1/:1-1032(+)